MSSEDAAFLRQQVQRLNAVLNRYQVKYLAPPASTPAGVFGEGDPPAPWLTDKSLLAPLMAEYDRHLEEMEGQLRNYQSLMGEMKLKMDRVVVENERLHAELRKSVETQLDGAATSLGVLTSDLTEEDMARNLQQQVQLANQEKEQALQMWRITSEELEQLNELYQEHVGDAQLHLQERQHYKEHLMEVQQFSQQLQVAKQRLETSNQQLAKTLGDQNVELNQLRLQLRQAKMELRTSDAKSEELGRAMQSLREELLKKEEEDTAMRGQEQATERRSQQMRKTVTQLDARLRLAAQDGDSLRRERDALQAQLGEAALRAAQLEEERFQAMRRASEGLQLLDEATLIKDQALLCERQKDEELERLKEAMAQLVQEAAVRTRKEVENVKKQCNVQISHLVAELSNLQMECSDKQNLMDRAIREKRAAEDELEKLYREGHGTEGEQRKSDVLLQRCLVAERARDEMVLSLQATQARLRAAEMQLEEERSRARADAQTLRSQLEAARAECQDAGEQLLAAQRQGDELRRHAEGMRREGQEATRAARKEVWRMQHDSKAQEAALEARLKELQMAGHASVEELHRMLGAQQSLTTRFREEARNATAAAQRKVAKLGAELSRHKQHAQELTALLEAARIDLVESQQLQAESQEKVERLQKRLAQAENRATAATQQLNRYSAQGIPIRDR
ncbi:unnamed protein product [Lampetra fluviatilis]